MASRFQVEVTISSAKDLKNVNWRHGKLKPYAVVWVDPASKFSTRVDQEGDTFPYWDEKLVIPFNSPVEDSTLHIDIVHADAAEDTKPLIGSAKLPLAQLVDEVGLGGYADKKLELKRPSGRPHGKLDVKVAVRESRYRAPEPSYAPPYGVPQSASRDYAGAPPPAPYGYAASGYTAAPPAGYPYSAAPPTGYPYSAAPPTGYPYSAAPAPGYYGQPGYGQAPQGGYVVEDGKKKSKFGGMGTGLAVGAVAGVLGGLALAEGVDALEDKIEDDVADRVEDDLGYDDDDF